MKKKRIVISGINLYQAGPLRVYYDFLDAICNSNIYEKYDITIFVHDKNSFIKYADNIEIIELKKSRKSYLFRLFYEYIFFYFWSIKRSIDIWVSLHDITPNVIAGKQYVYCHNPIVFHPDAKKLSFNNIHLFFYAKFYKIIYGINIKKNSSIILQHNWMGKEFERLYRINNIIVSRPICTNYSIIDNTGDKFIFFYPAFPREFKNFELICEANNYINKNITDEYEIWLTIDGTENEYSRGLIEKYKNSENIRFIGLKSFDEVMKLYEKTNCLVFPSKLETWGLPISEFKNSGRPILAIDYPYAHETIGEYSSVCFFRNNPKDLANKMIKLIKGENILQKTSCPITSYKTIEGWEELVKYIFLKTVF